ncbi:flagellar hook-basal body complex protein [Clostridium sp. AL.422]|uniref:flagellar hook-basal body complex protein n=1 Tax=Clostridium TaxID=1485 RepID=UPI00293DF7CF|nr:MULTISPECIES: flagellar hook-basal body complex protein [unclassified Clostridium]MDV4149681.1 flagellar hook-basal body complex protein [Clostridium sp. AL.422]
MLRTIWTAKTGMNANQDKLDAISNNIANSNTMGYKKIEVGFKDLLSESLDRAGNPINDKDSVIGTGTKTSEWYRDNTQGSLQETMLSTDLSIDGQGYFKITTSDGNELYTRDGSFAIDGSGKLVDKRGNKVELKYLNGYSENNVVFNKNNFLVDKKGQIYIKDGGNFTQVAEIPIYSAVGDRAFISVGDNLFSPATGVQVQRTNNFDIYQGALEGSNVDIATEFSDMILTQRAFELSSRGISTADEMWGMINNMRAR